MGSELAPDPVIAALAGAQHGVVARAQLLVLGLTERQVDRRLRAGRLHPVHRGVYAVGHRVLTVEGRWMAAVLAAGSGAALSHASAAAAWDLRRTNAGLIHVTLPGRAGRARRTGLRIHRCATVTQQDITRHRGIPITTPERTIVDLSRTLKERPLEHVIDVADQRGLISFDRLWTANSASLKAVLTLYAPAPTRSEMEERFLRLCDDHAIQRPQTNRHVDGIEVDFLWRDQNLIVEVDGYK